jgi:hypothetical protein
MIAAVTINNGAKLYTFNKKTLYCSSRPLTGTLPMKKKPKESSG